MSTVTFVQKIHPCTQYPMVSSGFYILLWGIKGWKNDTNIEIIKGRKIKQDLNKLNYRVINDKKLLLFTHQHG